jgi:putative membrane protein
LALEKSSSADIKAFANMMITDHSKANDELAALAKKHDIEVPDSTTLVKQAKEKILDLRDESFDAAYANNQVKAHEDTLSLFKKEANTVTDDKVKGATELKGFAQKMLPALEKHLQMAKKLQTAHPDK